ncbi:hypothetical protein, partial [Escherichia coli]|uniref:hypothetical protein n=1 Tax=Escherichia coli TaxID=562 RepID=UPI001BAFF5E3
YHGERTATVCFKSGDSRSHQDGKIKAVTYKLISQAFMKLFTAVVDPETLADMECWFPPSFVCTPTNTLDFAP